MTLIRLNIILLTVLLSFCNTPHQNSKTKNIEPIIYSKIEMNLSSFGVESEGFPSIKAIIDFKNDSSFCERWYDNPIYKDSSYSLTKAEITTILNSLLKSDVKTLQKEYTANMTDQPTSTIIIFTTKDTIQFKDYGLLGPYPLDQLYKLVYKLNINFR